MSLQIDAEQNERKHLHKFANLANRQVLEIGCGEGRLTWSFARSTHRTVGVDPDRNALRVGTAEKPHDLEKKVDFAGATSEYLPFSKASFDLAIFAWSF